MEFPRMNRRTFVLSTAFLAVTSRSSAFAETSTGSATPAVAPVLKIVSPVAGDVVESDDIDLELDVKNFTLDAAQIGSPDVDGVGHVHVLLDGATIGQLTGFYAETSITISGLGVDAGKHSLAVMLSANAHGSLTETLQQVEFEYKPMTPRPLPAAEDLGQPGITLASPADGDSVDAVFPVELTSTNFHASADLEGKPNVPGYGHYHVFIDKDMSAEAMKNMTLDGLLLMPGEDSFDLDLSAWGSGEHTVWIGPAQNDHSMFAEFDHVVFKVSVH